MYLHNTLTRKKERFTPKKPGVVSIYSCGPTVYNRVHVGNIRAILFCDTLQRWLRFGENMKIEWVMNITDVDDKTIRDSKKEYPSEDPLIALQKFTTHYAEVFFDDIEKVGVDRSHLLSTPFATHYIEQMQSLVTSIVNNGYAYISDGSVYLDVQKYRKDYVYGRLVSLDFENMKSTERVDNDEYEKDSVSDFVLWKGVKEGEPFWSFEMTIDGESVEIPGRPGWHIECSAMSKSFFPDFPFDIHTGGVDLCFPHHEDEICQAQAGYGLDTARFWAHNEHLMVEGKKMSKSLGNFYTLADLVKKGFSPEVIRFFLVTNHYRKKVNLSEESLNASAKMLSRIRGFVSKVVSSKASAVVQNSSSVAIEQLVELSSFFEAMRDDLNTPVAIAHFFSFVKESAANIPKDNDLTVFVEAVKFVEKILGVRFMPQEESFPKEVWDLVELRDIARQNKDWKKSDSIRDTLANMGYTVSDVSNKTVIWKT